VTQLKGIHTKGSMATRFDACIPLLCGDTLKSVKSLGFEQMTPVQAAAIPLFLNHKDVVVEVGSSCFLGSLSCPLQTVPLFLPTRHALAQERLWLL
jgi:hypothetical protein